MHAVGPHLLQFPQSHPQRIRWVVVSLAVWVCLTAAGSLWTPCCWQARLNKQEGQPLSQTRVNTKCTDAHALLAQSTTWGHTHQHTGRTGINRKRHSWTVRHRLTACKRFSRPTLWQKRNVKMERGQARKQADLGSDSICDLPRAFFKLPFLFPFFF